jgi:hypothetical protein
MGVLTSQKITSYYERYRSIDVTFTKEIIQVTGMVTNQIFLKCMGDFWPCVVYSASFEGAKVVVNIKTGLVDKLQQANNTASLRLCFKNQDSSSPVAFFVGTRSAGYAPYLGSKDMALFTLQFTQRPPDDLIEIVGRLLDANMNSAKRRNERIPLTDDSQRRLKILVKASAAFIQGVPRRCILKDLSFSGAKLIMMGVPKFLIDKESALRVDFDDPRESFLIRGKFIRAEYVEGRKELVALAIEFTDAVVPMGYKIRLNDFLSVVRADTRGEEKTTAGKTPAEALNAMKKPPEPSSAAPAPEALTPETPPPASAVSSPAPEPPEAGKTPAAGIPG